MQIGSRKQKGIGGFLRAANADSVAVRPAADEAPVEHVAVATPEEQILGYFQEHGDSSALEIDEAFTNLTRDDVDNVIRSLATRSAIEPATGTAADANALFRMTEVGARALKYFRLASLRQ